MIKKIRQVFFVLLIIMALAVPAIQAFDSSELVVIRSKIFRQFEEIKPLLTGSRDVILISSMWDSCVVTMSQLDAYFFMIGIFNTIEEKDVTMQALDYIEKWLVNIKNTNVVNIKSLSSVSYEVEPSISAHMRIMKDTLGELNQAIVRETKKIEILKRRMQIR